MAELPEVEVTRRELDKECQGRKIRSVKVMGTKKMLPGSASKPAFVKKVEGRTIHTLTRRGTLLVFDIGNSDDLVVDLGQAGHFRRTKAGESPLPNAKMVMVLSKGQIQLVDQGQTATMRVVPRDRFTKIYFDEDALGFDPIEDPMPWVDFGQLLKGVKRPLKALLMDQKFVVGIGPIYSDEILHAALLRHDRIADDLNTQEVRRLYRSIVEAMHNAVKYRGVSFGGRTDLFGAPGNYDSLLEVYDRAGERSRNGRGVVLSTKVSGKTHYYCEYQV